MEFNSILNTNPDKERAPDSTPTPSFTPAAPPSLAAPPLLTPFPPYISTLIALVGQIRQELETQILKLLSLNPSRREAIANYLDRLAGLPPSPHSQPGTPDAGGGLRRWVDTLQTPAQEAALRLFFEEVALLTVGQALLLKSWSDRGIRALKPDDLRQLNWTLSTALKPYLPMDREGWQITRPNLYSWYNPSPLIQRDLWKALESVQLEETDAHFPNQLLRLVRQTTPEWPEWKNYDPRFFQSLWDHLPSFGFQPEVQMGPIKRKAVLFSPTLRDGIITRTGPSGVHWIALEKNPFQLFLAELSQLWPTPSAPPLWALGTGLEVFGGEQLSLSLGVPSPKPSTYARITEMEACDLGLLFEERTIRGGFRSGEAVDFRTQADALPHLKKLRAIGTSLGDLQACVAATKLRPGGILFWAREEPLGRSDGTEMLGFLLERARLLCEWNLSELEHSLPVSAPLFPKFIYLFSRETDLQKRLNHRPVRIHVQGQIRSHIEVPSLLGDAFQAYHHPNAGEDRGPWQIHLHQSPVAQKDWVDKWPDPSRIDAIRSIEALRSCSMPLASFATIRAVTEPPQSLPKGYGAFWVEPGQGLKPDTRQLKTFYSEEHPEKASGLLILLQDESWTPPLTAFLESKAVSEWLDHHVERKGEKWALSEAALKLIPLPKNLLEAMGVPMPSIERSGERSGPLNPVAFQMELEKWRSDLTTQPRKVRETLPHLPLDDAGKKIRAHLFVHATRLRKKIRLEQAQLFSLVTVEGKIRWQKLMEILPHSERAPITLSRELQSHGNLPLHLPIDRIERVRSPLPGILFATQMGPSLHLSATEPRFLEIIWDQLEGLHHPTWSELVQLLNVPRSLEVAEGTAHDILRAHGEQSGLLRELTDLLFSCPLI